MRIGGDRESIEGFNDIGKMTVTDLQNLIYSTYKADVQAIKNLADTAAKLQAGGLTIPGNLGISGNQKVDGTMDIKGATTIGGTMDIKGATTIGGKVAITGGVTIGGDISLLSNTETISKFILYNDNSNGRKEPGLYLHSYKKNGDWNSMPITIDEKGNVSIAGNLYVGGDIIIKNVTYKTNGNTLIKNLSIREALSYITPLQDVIVRDGNGNGLNICRNGGGVGGDGWVHGCPCDKRIKENIKQASTTECLDKINKLPMQNYNFIDKKFYKGQEVYGLIAQEVKEVFPEAVEINKQHIPNINKSATHQLVEDNVILTVDNKTNVDDNLQLFVNDRPINAIVIKATETTILVAKWEEYKDDDKVLVYGTEIDDFHGLNQQYMGILSLGGIQELSKQIDKLKSENNDLRIRLENNDLRIRLENNDLRIRLENNDLRIRLEKLETLLQVKP